MKPLYSLVYGLFLCLKRAGGGAEIFKRADIASGEHSVHKEKENRSW